MLDLRPNERVLDVGCGIGGPPHKCLCSRSLECEIMPWSTGQINALVSSTPVMQLSAVYWAHAPQEQSAATTKPPHLSDSNTACPRARQVCVGPCKQIFYLFICIHTPSCSSCRLGIVPHICCLLAGGGDFYMAAEADAHVHGVDLSVNMVLIALERASAARNGFKVRVSLRT